MDTMNDTPICSPMTELPELPPIEETWENAKQMFINTAEVSVIIAERVDNFMNIRDMAYKFWGDELKGLLEEDRIAYLKYLHELSIATYKAILDVIKGFEMEEFLKDEMKDYFDVLIPKVDEIDTEKDLMNAMLIFLTVKPWGEKMTALHHSMLDEKRQREYREKDN